MPKTLRKIPPEKYSKYPDEREKNQERKPIPLLKNQKVAIKLLIGAAIITIVYLLASLLVNK